MSSFYIKLYIYFALLLLCVATGFYFYKKMPPAFKIMVWFIAFTIVTESIAIPIGLTTGNNQWLYFVYNLIKIGFFTWLYTTLIKTPSIKKIIFSAGISLAIAYAVLLGWGHYRQYKAIAQIIVLITLAIYCLLFLLSSLKNEAKTGLINTTGMAFTFVLLFYCFINITYWVLFLTDAGKGLAVFLFNIHYYSNIFFYGGITWCFFIEKRNYST